MKRLMALIPIFVVFIVLLIIIPLPVALLDTMFVLNIAVSVIVFLTTLYIKDTLQFSVLPTLLLITTVFRIALNVSSTRLILSNGGEAGKVIKTFGDFVLGGNVVVGFVVFLIVVAVQFVVIVKGSERVAEVAARFTLDAMPGKQMAIDADLSAGIITEQEAIERRQKVQKEADFFGAMDGASKFVKGDAILSIIVVMVNFLGGLIVGMVEGGGTFRSVLNLYSIATVGDGLASQLPSLMISIATGIVVTRAASTESFNVDIAKQFLSQPFALIISGGVLLCFTLIPGFPKVATMMLGALLVGLGFWLLRAPKGAVVAKPKPRRKPAASQPVSEIDYYKNAGNIYELIAIEPLCLELGFSLIALASSEKVGNLADRIVMLRKQFAVDTGMVFPTIRLRDSSLINPNQYVIKVKGEEVAKGEVLIDYLLALDPGDLKGEINGIDAIEPAYGIPSKWILKADKEKAELLGYTLIDPVSVIISHLSEVIRHHAFELLSRKDVEDLLENIKKKGRVSLDGIVPETISIIDVQKIFCNLLREFVPIKDMETIVGTIAENVASVRDTDLLTEYVRQSLKRSITRTFARDGSLMVIALSPKVEKLIMSNIKKMDNKTYLNLDPEVLSEIVMGVKAQIEKNKSTFTVPIILTSAVVRLHISRLISQFVPNVVVLSFGEIESNIQVLAVGNVDLKEAS
ncbi:MAG: flagellar biosynthesis protein FlhA [Oscillospiraceae bacterium]|jgi:flagellar biosynthesis protein FlhA|nr:flagellar biosynthesis protein FlhA [Oscillospiraceae bacterium]